MVCKYILGFCFDLLRPIGTDLDNVTPKTNKITRTFTVKLQEKHALKYRFYAVNSLRVPSEKEDLNTKAKTDESDKAKCACII